MAHGVGESRDTPDAARLPSWLPEPMNGNTEYVTMRSGVAVVVGAILVMPAIVLELMGLGMALSDPCAGVSGCQPIVDMRPIGWVLAVFALMVGLPAAWMVHWGSRPTSE